MKRVLLLHLLIGSLATLGCQADANLNGGHSGGADGGGLGDGASTGDGSSADLTPGRCDAVNPVDGLVLHVNPVAGDDAAGTGSGMARGTASADCAFRSITRAAAAASAAGKRDMRIVIDVTATAGGEETFPVLLPADTTLAPAAGAVVTVVVGAGDGFHILGSNSTIESLTIDGQHTAANGVVV